MAKNLFHLADRKVYTYVSLFSILKKYKEVKMNRRIAKKKYKAAMELMKTSTKDGYTVSIINQIFVDKNGKRCSSETEGARLITLRRPKIVYNKSN